MYIQKDGQGSIHTDVRTDRVAGRGPFAPKTLPLPLNGPPLISRALYCLRCRSSKQTEKS